MAPTVFFLSMPFGVAPAAIQEIMPNSMRGQASAIYLFVVTLFGLGVGPTAVALVTDFVFADDMALRYSLLLVTLAAVLGAVVLLGSASSPYRASLEHLKDWSLRRKARAARIGRRPGSRPDSVGEDDPHGIAVGTGGTLPCAVDDGPVRHVLRGAATGACLCCWWSRPSSRPVLEVVLGIALVPLSIRRQPPLKLPLSKPMV